MTIASVRIYLEPLTRERELALTASHWGFAEWFTRRLKPIREQLRGDEAKGVDIVNLMLREDAAQVLRPNQWQRIDNAFQFEHVCDLKPLEAGTPLGNVEKLMGFYAEIARHAPWPQVRALSAALAVPLTDEDRLTLRPYLQWPRGEMVSESMARRLLAAQRAHGAVPPPL